MQVKCEVEPDLSRQSTQDDFQRRSLLGDEQDSLPRAAKAAIRLAIV